MSALGQKRPRQSGRGGRACPLHPKSGQTRRRLAKSA